MLRVEYWKRDYDAEHVGYTSINVEDDETVRVAYPLLKHLMEHAGLTQIEEPHV